MHTLHVKKGDIVQIISGKDKGKTGKILKAFPSKDRVLIEGINIYKKHIKPRSEQEKGQTVMVPRPLHVSNVKKIEAAAQTK